MVLSPGADTDPSLRADLKSILCSSFDDIKPHNDTSNSTGGNKLADTRSLL